MRILLTAIVLLTLISHLFAQEEQVDKQAEQIRIQKEKIFTELQSTLNRIDSIDLTEGIEHTDNSITLENIEVGGVANTPIEGIGVLVNNYNDYSVAYNMRKLIDLEISELRYKQPSNNYLLKIADLNEKKKMVDKRLDLIVDNNYMHYNVQETSKSWLKGIHLYHDNDILMFSSKNADRDYTGGFRFEFMTDMFKMRLFKYFGNSEGFLSYQSIFIGGEGYTPYIRFTKEEIVSRGILYQLDSNTEFLTAASLDSIGNYMRSNQQRADRPFASFQYFGRGKYRLHHSGIFRIESLFKLGQVGGTIGKNIQGVIHQDLTTESQRVLNWEDQIASGGRLALNIEHKLDLSLFSRNSLIIKSAKKAPDNLRRVVKNLNIYFPIELAFGTVNTHIGTGLAISNRAFPETSGINDGKLVNFKGLTYFERVWKNTYINFEYRYRRVIHNSMLEGVGFFKPFKDDPLDDEAVTIYRLKENDVERNLHMFNWQVGIRMNKLSVYYRQTRFINPEFKVDGVDPIYDDFATEKWYGYGRIGFNFLL